MGDGGVMARSVLSGMRAVCGFAVAVLGCGGGSADSVAATDTVSVEVAEDNARAELRLPDGFLFGVATAGFQNDMGCPTLAPEVCEDRGSDWYQWVTDPALVADPTTFVTGEPLGNGPGMRELYATHLAAAQETLGANAIRLSIEWGRLFPDGAAESAESAEALQQHAVAREVQWYRELFAEARRRGLEPVVTLSHYTLPLWLHDGKACHADLDACEDRGWLDRERMARAAKAYADFCGVTFGDLVDTWATLNEPLANVLAGYVLPSADRSHPPGVQLKVAEAIDVLNNQIYGHAAMVDGLRSGDQVDADGRGDGATFIGTVVNLAAFRASNADDPAAADAVRHASWVHNELFLEGAANGQLDVDVDGVLEAADPALTDRLDWVGVNYYTKLGVMPLGAPLLEGRPWLDFLPVTEEGLFQVFPEGLSEVLRQAARFGKPIIITENGAMNPGDDAGEAFLKPHLRALGTALGEGLDVRGYLYWTLVDNYEWNHGMALKFGLFAFEPASKALTLRPIGRAFAEIARARGF
jgi:beta-galactosidase